MLPQPWRAPALRMLPIFHRRGGAGCLRIMPRCLFPMAMADSIRFLIQGAGSSRSRRQVFTARQRGSFQRRSASPAAFTRTPSYFPETVFSPAGAVSRPSPALPAQPDQEKAQGMQAIRRVWRAMPPGQQRGMSAGCAKQAHGRAGLPRPQTAGFFAGASRLPLRPAALTLRPRVYWPALCFGQRAR